MSAKRKPHAYDNESGDWWVRVDQVPDVAAARAMVDAEVLDELEYCGIEVVELWEGAIGERYARHAERPAHHFRDASATRSAVSAELAGE